MVLKRDNSREYTRRNFNRGMLSLGLGMAAYSQGVSYAVGLSPNRISDQALADRLEKAPPLYCLAYINPTLEAEKGQEPTIAKFPITVVPQNSKVAHQEWRDRIRALNPEIVMLSYQMTIEETWIPGPGHERMRALGDSAWVTYGPITPTIEFRGKEKRIYDPRNSSWREAFIEACALAIESDNFDGLFLDQCSIFRKIVPVPAEFDEQMAALQHAIEGVRAEWPGKLIVANSRYHYSGVNGEMNEGRTKDWKEEFSVKSEHLTPYMDLALIYFKNDSERAMIPDLMRQAHRAGALFYACENAQKVYWDPAYDELMRTWSAPKRSSCGHLDMKKKVLRNVSPLSMLALLMISVLVLAYSLYRFSAPPLSGFGWTNHISAAFLLWAVTYVAMAYLRYRTVYLFTTVYIICLSLFHLGLVLSARFGVPLPASWANPNFSADVQAAAWSVMLALSALGVGFSLGALKFSSVSTSIQKYPSLKHNAFWFARWSGYGLLAACIPLLGLALASYGNILEYSRAEIFRSDADSRGFGVFMMIFPGAVAINYLTARSTLEKRVAMILAVTAIALLMLSGYRSAALFTLFVGVVVWVKLGHRVPIWLAGILIVAVLIGISFSGHLRTLGAYNEIDSQALLESWQSANVDQSLMAMGQTLGVLAHVIRLVPETDPYRFGQTYWLALRSSIPNIGLQIRTEFDRGAVPGSIGRAESVRELAPGDWLTFRILKNQFDLNQGVGFSGVGEPYLNFGVPGIVLIFAVLGACFGWLDSRDISIQPKLLLFCSAMLWPLMRTVRNDFANFIKPMIFMIIILAIWWLITKGFALSRRNYRRPLSWQE